MWFKSFLLLRLFIAHFFSCYCGGLGTSKEMINSDFGAWKIIGDGKYWGTPIEERKDRDIEFCKEKELQWDYDIHASLITCKWWIFLTNFKPHWPCFVCVLPASGGLPWLINLWLLSSFILPSNTANDYNACRLSCAWQTLDSWGSVICFSIFVM
jgi:hypothetical protein